ncbi:flagellar basal body-associated FliL family protein [Azospirillum baldaniorum]|nr:flagellar basal body-associated FliL family protein [Azospirillum baldaniorum]
MPHLVNAQQEFLRNIDQHDLRGSAGLLRLREELRRRFNLILGPDTVSDVLLRSLLTQ